MITSLYICWPVRPIQQSEIISIPVFKVFEKKRVHGFQGDFDKIYREMEESINPLAV